MAIKNDKESKQLNSLVTLLPDKYCTQETIHLLLANPININLFESFSLFLSYCHFTSQNYF